MICSITLIFFFSAVVACLVKKTKKHNEHKMRMLCVIFQFNRFFKVTFTT